MIEAHVSTRDVQQFEGDALAVGVFADEAHLQGPAAALDEALAGVIAELVASGEVTGAADEVTLLHTLGKIEPTRVAIIGLGARGKFSADRVRRSASLACRALRDAGAHEVGLALAWAESGVNLASAARAATEGALLGLYEFKRYKTQRGDKPQRAIAAITILGRGREPALRSAVQRGRILAESANFARDLGNEPPNTLTPTEMGERARAMAAEVGLECDIHGKDWIREQRWARCWASIRAASRSRASSCCAKRRGAEANTPALALVGKGITFDSGGISLKPAEDMEEMKFDMCGGAAVIGAMRAIALLKPPINVVGIVPATENMPGGRPSPGDILRAATARPSRSSTPTPKGG